MDIVHLLTDYLIQEEFENQQKCQTMKFYQIWKKIYIAKVGKQAVSVFFAGYAGFPSLSIGNNGKNILVLFLDFKFFLFVFAN